MDENTIDPKTPPRFTVIVSREMFDAIEEFRFNNRYQTRKDAVNALIQLGLDALTKDTGSND